MKAIVISYSYTGNNKALATSISKEFGAKHIIVTEAQSRTTSTIMLDIVFNRTPRVSPMLETVDPNDLIIFVGPVWLGQAATPLRAYFKKLKTKIGQYAFVTICGGAEGPNPKLAAELTKRLGKDPAALIELHIADLLPADPKPDRNATMAYRLNESDIKILTNKAIKALQEIMVMHAA